MKFWQSAVHLVYMSNFLSFVLLSIVSHNDNDEQFYICHAEQFWAITWHYKLSAFNTFIIVSILYIKFALFWLVLNSSLMNITDFMLWNIKDVILIESKLLLLSSQFGTVTSSSLCILHLCLICWGVGHNHSNTLELWHTSLKWLLSPHALHVFPNAEHCLWLCAAKHYLHLYILSFSYCSFSCSSLSLSVVLPLWMWSKSSTFFISSNALFYAPCAAILCIHISTSSLSISLGFHWVVGFFIISCIISSSFMPLRNCSLRHLWCFCKCTLLF